MSIPRGDRSRGGTHRAPGAARDARDIRTLIEEGRADPSVAPGRWTPTRWNPPGEAPRRDDRKTFDILSRRARTFIDRAETADTVLDHDVAKRVELVFGAVARTARNLVTFRGDPPVAPETLSGIALDAARTRGWA